MTEPTAPGAYPPAPPPAGGGPYGAPMPPAQPGYGMPAAAATKPPTPVKTAMILMLVSAAFNILSGILVVANKSAIRKEAIKQYPTYTPQHIDQLVNGLVATAIVLDVIVAAIYVAMVFFMRKQRNWARIVTWVITGIFTLLQLVNLRQLGSGWNVIFALVSLAINIAIIVSLCQKRANAFFGRRPRPTS